MFISKSIHFYRSQKQINYKKSHIGLQKRTFRFESGDQWKKIEFPDRDIEKYVLSFESSGVKYHLLGIVPFHTHSNLLVKKFVDALKSHKPTVLLDSYNLENIKSNEVEEIANPTLTFLNSFSKSFGYKYIKSKEHLINGYSLPKPLELAESLFIQNNIKPIRCGRTPYIMASRTFKFSDVFDRRKILLQLQSSSNRTGDEIYERGEETVSKFSLDLLYDVDYISKVDSKTGIVIAENALNFSYHLKNVQNSKVVAGIVDYVSIDMIMYSWDKDIAWAKELNQIETSNKNSKGFLLDYMLASLNLNLDQKKTS